MSGDVDKLQHLSEIQIPASALAMENLKEKTEKVIDVSEYLPDGIVLADENANSVAVTILIEKDGTKSFEISVGSVSVLNLDSDLSINYESADALDIQIRGPEDALNKINIDESVSIDLAKYTEPGTYNVPIQVSLPEHCTSEKSMSIKVVLENKAKANVKDEEKTKENN